MNGNTDSYEVLLKAFIKDVGWINHQINSFNEFVNVRLQKIIDEIKEIPLEVETGEFRIRLGRVRVEKPCIKEADGAIRSITPAEARIRNMTYSAPILVEMIPIINGIEQEKQDVKIGDLPIMLKSDKCILSGLSREKLIELGEDPDDPGGYFIINGTERVIVMSEQILSNLPIIENRKGIEIARINSESSGFIQMHLIERRNGILYISFANVKKLPLVILLRALGLETDKEIIDAISPTQRMEEDLYYNLGEYEIKSSEEAKVYIAKKLHIFQEKISRVNDILDKYLLPHIGQEKKNRKEKALYLCLIASKLIMLGAGEIKEQDIDHYGNKRIRCVGDFLETLFRSVLMGKYGLMTRIVYRYQRMSKRGKLPSLQSIIEGGYLTNRISSHMATGQWIGGLTGICQRLERTNWVRTIEHLRNVLSPLSSTQEHFRARALHPTQFGRLCAEETPEGINIGLRKYLAIFGIISQSANKEDIKAIYELIGSENGKYPIFLNGRLVGKTDKPIELVEKLRQKRRLGLLSPYIGISWLEDLNEVRINCDAGRLERPLIIIENGKPRLTPKHIEALKENKLRWNDLVKQGIIEYLDAEEEDNALVALFESDITSNHTHLEINPGSVLGISANIIPFPNHNRGDRVNIGAKMCGQALGIYSTNFLLRADTKSDILIYPQTPLVDTTVSREIGLEEHAQGQNLVVAMMSFYGYNMEDAIILNKASIERGLGRSLFFRTYEAEERKYWAIERDEIRIPPKGIRGYRQEDSYKWLDKDGIIHPESRVESDDVLIGKTSPLRFFGPAESFLLETQNRYETSETIRHEESGVVDKVLLTETIDGNKLVKVTVRDQRIPELGDKFATRHGQKGVISLIVPQEDMPFTADGIIPDIIINPHAIPSRMTLGQLLEILGAKISAITCEKVNGSIFNETPEEIMRAKLKENGFIDDGREILFNGITGMAYECPILIGPLFYQKLHHMVANKLQVRARGPVTLLTKQPTEGRSKQGGLRLGEMEKDCLIAHGAALLLKERFSSDKAIIPICERCGLVAIHDFAKGRKYCPVCKKSKIIDVEMSYAFNLMLNELKCMGIYPKIKFR
ncbi:MAG: DNA-directed RNA polymerase subunit B [Candidatus Aenigmatarchaeota archaeon]